MQPCFYPTRKMTSNFFLKATSNKAKNGRRPQKEMKIEDDLKTNKYESRPQKIKWMMKQ
jgi:hypothetical protein